MATRRLNLLLKEISDPEVQYNFWRLKEYIDCLAGNGEGGGTTVNRNVVINQAAVPSNVSFISRIMDCGATVAIGDWVYHSELQNNFALSAIDSQPPSAIIGKVIGKPSPITCEVVHSGIAPDNVSRGTVYLGASGESTTICPQDGYIQRLGTSYGNGEMLINPEIHRVVRK